MKIINYILILSIFFITISCIQENEFDENKQVVVTGKIHQYNGENAKLYFIYSQPGVKNSKELIDIDSEGNFEYRFDGYIPLDAMILERNTFANINFIYHPGDSIHLEFETNDKQIPLLKTVKFAGDATKTNNQIIKFQILREENNLGYGAINSTESYKNNVDDFIIEMNSVKEKQLDIYKKFIEEFSPTDEAKSWAELFALETYYYFLDDYSYGKKNLPDNYFKYAKEILPLTFDKLICWKVLENRISSYTRTNVFPQFAKQYPDIELGSAFSDSINQTDLLFLNFVLDKSSNKLLSQLVISNIYLSLFEANLLDSYQRNLDVLKTELDASYIFKSLHASYEKVYKFLNSPNELTGDILKKIENTPINETFNKILDNNKGKIIYLDCWATWCGPCKKAMPASKKLMSRFNGKDVVFVYLCIESDEKVWKKLLSEFNLEGGQHYLMNTKQSEFFRDVMKVDGIPYYFLINQKGQLVEQGHHIHPSEKLTEEKITNLLNES